MTDALSHFAKTTIKDIAFFILCLLSFWISFWHMEVLQRFLVVFNTSWGRVSSLCFQKKKKNR